MTIQMALLLMTRLQPDYPASCALHLVTSYPADYEPSYVIASTFLSLRVLPQKYEAISMPRLYCLSPEIASLRSQ